MRTLGIIGIIFLMAVIAIVGTSPKLQRIENVDGTQKRRYVVGFAIFAVLPIILWAGFRDGAGYVDTNAYIRMYKLVPDNIMQAGDFIANVDDKDPGFTVFLIIIKMIFGTSYRPFLLIMAIIEMGIVALFFRKYSSQFVLSLFFFVASAEYFSWIFNGMRQFLAVSILLVGFGLLLRKKYMHYIILVLIASTIHGTALIMLPILFIVQGKPWNKKTMITILFAVMILFATSRFTSLLDSLLQSTQYADAVSSWNDDGTNPIRVLFQMIPTILAFIGRKQLQKEDDRTIAICTNMSIISSMLWLVSMVTSGIYMGRLPIYANMFNYILLPYELDRFFAKESAKIAKIGMVIVYLSYYYYQFHFAWGTI